jgi:hypothetical protein
VNRGAIIPGSLRTGFVDGDAKSIESDPTADVYEFEVNGGKLVLF